MRSMFFVLLAIALMMAAIPGAAAPAPGGTFIDDDGSIHEGAIETIAALGITEGCDSVNGDQYCPGQSVTRAEMSVFLVRALNEEGNLPSYQGYFPDVPSGAWYTPWVERLFELGLTTGRPDGTFGVGDPVLRSEMAVFLIRLRGEEGNLTSYKGTFTDSPDGVWFTPYTELMFESGVTAGCAINPRRYCPLNPVRRDEMATFVMRALGLDPMPPPARPSVNQLTLKLETVATGLAQPLFVDAPSGDDRLFIVEQPGRIRLVEGGNLLSTPFLDVTSLVASGGERGLLGLAFHPQYNSNGRFYIDYTNIAGDTVIAEYMASTDPNRADLASARVLLTIDQPASNHNGGMLAFGPDGMLYIAMGDGGGGGDTYGNGQRPDTLLATLLRIDVNSGARYGIPSDNPFVAGGGAPEVWVYGLRNPWRFSFDGNRLYIGDVGQNAWEEIDVIDTGDGGANLGWSKLEGTHCYGGSCSAAGTVMPILEYAHSQGCSVTGGYVYRGSAIPALDGHYFYGDFCGGWVQSFRYAGGASWADAHDWSGDFGKLTGLTSFGTDGHQEMYITVSTGDVYRIVAGG